MVPTLQWGMSEPVLANLVQDRLNQRLHPVGNNLSETLTTLGTWCGRFWCIFGLKIHFKEFVSLKQEAMLLSNVNAMTSRWRPSHQTKRTAPDFRLKDSVKKYFFKK